jgi:sporulation protein YlmC with PRC-barrel domain
VVPTTAFCPGIGVASTGPALPAPPETITWNRTCAAAPCGSVALIPTVTLPPPAGAVPLKVRVAASKLIQDGSEAADQVSANTYIGQSVYNGNNESIGSVNDLILKKDGGFVAAIVGVGGFLGIGEKNVAVPMEKITVAQNTQDGSVKLTTSETSESLKAAPEFKTLAMLAAEKAPAATGTDTTATGSTTPK